MALLDSGWMAQIRQAPAWVLLGVAFGTGLAWYLDLGIPESVRPYLAVCCLLATCLFLTKAALASWTTLRRRQSAKVKRNFTALSDDQKQFLGDLFDRGSREFEVTSETASLRWFEELKAWNYVEYGSTVSPIRFVSFEDDHPYSVTEQGWQELERKLNR